MHQGAISDNFLAKKGLLGDIQKRGVIGCETEQNGWRFNFFFFPKFLLQFTKISQNLMILPE